MLLTVAISDEVQHRLAIKAQAAGVDVPTYAAHQLGVLAQLPRTLREISGPTAEAFKSSHMTEDQLADLLEEEKHAMRAERTSRSGSEPPMTPAK